MTNIIKLEFEAHDLTGKNYLSWILDAEVHLISMNLEDTIKEGNEMSQQDRANALIFLRHHLNDGLKLEYLTVKEPREIWKNLKERFDHQRTNSSTLILCGEKVTDQDMLEKTFFTFHASNVLLQQQYREHGFQRYSELISCLLVAEQNNELLMKNHQMCLTGSTPFPEANGTTFPEKYVIAFPEANANSTQNHNNGRGRGRGRGRERGQRRYYQQQNGKKHKTSHQQWNSNNEEAKEKSSKIYEEKCYRCGMEGHWSRTCRTAKHLVDLYQKSIKENGKMEINFVENDDPIDITHLDVSDFFANPDENIDNLIGGGVLENNK
ncbi:uncharacterized protein LOC142529410 [Primulina tabacum]|uniref:uncharacterized protein LOC142529410 n=1 Tax=Primulina tabacum TaxID=48773 RepID=UPI003F59EE6F